MAKITDGRVRNLTLADMGIDLDQPPDVEAGDAPEDDASLPPDDELLTAVRAALDLGFAGVILVGPPGTGKTWYAPRIALALSGGDEQAVRTVQFHPSYQYEDFMEGYVPNEEGGFRLEPKLFAGFCAAAEERREITHTLIVDEISRCDVVRVFGEALTYLERDKRDLPFSLASGTGLTVPPNLVVIATMNPWDKGVDELDVALERRFAQIDLPPDEGTLRTLLAGAGASEEMVEKVASFFAFLQEQEEETVRLGHAYFLRCTDEEATRRIWDFRLRPVFDRACRLDRELFGRLEVAWSGRFGGGAEPESDDDPAS